jgi:hypothetical protein
MYEYCLVWKLGNSYLYLHSITTTMATAWTTSQEDAMWLPLDRANNAIHVVKLIEGEINVEVEKVTP